MLQIILCDIIWNDHSIVWETNSNLYILKHIY